ncbi:ammonium transporter [Skermania sp. ID1734]|uniref:ammonium transporter n=1 Tax=Skermania sp. ID1734 TaxID=2597516 RepID=UPI00117D6257|nr:ammonium transporter [Skermania sp. ID1734]TSD94472.1 ammonium transporter [Skermania sp. ID1734]
MNLRRITATAVLAIAATGITAGTAYAAPATPDVKYDAKVVGKDVVTTLTNGTFHLVDNNKSWAVQDANGHDLVVMPLTYNVAGRSFPIDSKISNDNKTLTLSAVTDAAKSVAAPALHPVASNAENQKAMGDFSAKLGIAMSVGGLIGMTIGALVGLLGFAGGPAGLVSVPLGAGIGGVIGTIAAGGPTLIGAGIDLVNTFNAPPGTTRWNNP